MSWVHAVIDVPAGAHARTAEFWARALGWSAGTPWPTHPELQSFEPPSGAPYIHLQRIAALPRVHVDVESDSPAATVEHALELGAELVAEQDRWHTLSSPGELPFCVLPASTHEAPQPTTFGDGHHARMVQVCIDSPLPVHAAEVAFWRALLPGRWVTSPAAEFAGKWHDDAGSPLQLLFQQLDETSGPVRAHLDQGTDNLPAEVRRLVGLGATEIGAGRGWHVLHDVAGLAFCVTQNSPAQSRYRDIA
jgi:Glyoxalase-like domain